MRHSKIWPLKTGRAGRGHRRAPAPARKAPACSDSPCLLTHAASLTSCPPIPAPCSASAPLCFHSLLLSTAAAPSPAAYSRSCAPPLLLHFFALSASSRVALTFYSCFRNIETNKLTAPLYCQTRDLPNTDRKRCERMGCVGRGEGTLRHQGRAGQKRKEQWQPQHVRMHAREKKGQE